MAKALSQTPPQLLAKWVALLLPTAKRLMIYVTLISF